MGQQAPKVFSGFRPPSGRRDTKCKRSRGKTCRADTCARNKCRSSRRRGKTCRADTCARKKCRSSKIKTGVLIHLPHLKGAQENFIGRKSGMPPVERLETQPDMQLEKAARCTFLRNPITSWTMLDCFP